MSYLEYCSQNTFTLIEARKIAIDLLHLGYDFPEKSVSSWTMDDKKLKKNGQINQYTHKNKKGEIIKCTFYFEQIASSIAKNKDWLPGLFSLPHAKISYFDSSMDMGSGTAGFGMSITSNQFGPNFPIKPKISGEAGAITSSFQKFITNNIFKLHKRIVSGSNAHNAAAMPDTDWFNDIRLLINECVSLIDIHLHTLYNIAKFNGSVHNLLFDESTFGYAYNRRLKDKFSWLNLSTQKNFNCDQKIMQSFNTLREIRNHLNHFDPPCFAYTIIDIEKWLNCVPDIGRLSWQIRNHLQQPLNNNLIKIIALPKVISKVKKKPTDESHGYNSCKWPK